MSRLLLVEDDATLTLSLRLALSDRGHSVAHAGTLADARRLLAGDGTFDLVVLDLGLPDGDGLDLCRERRAAGDFVPILALTARGTLEARVRGLTHGADDYVTKPFDLPELLARVDALLRRRGWLRPSGEIAVGGLTVDLDTREASDASGPVTLSDLELRLLSYLLEREGAVVTREQLLTDVWELPAASRTRTIDTFVYRLRKLIEPDPAHPTHLTSVRGAGYRLQR